MIKSSTKGHKRHNWTSMGYKILSLYTVLVPIYKYLLIIFTTSKKHRRFLSL